MSAKALRVGSLFTGIGGFDLAFQRVGMEPVWQVEIDKWCNQVLRRHWPDVERHKDVKEFDDYGSVDLICGGFPCQDLSVAGRREGLSGKRSGLWWEFHRVLQEARPSWVVIENVTGLLSSNGGRDMGTVVGALGELGYRWAYRVFDSQYYGVAQRRRRVFIVGYLGDGRAAEVLFEREGCEWNPPTRPEAGEGATHYACRRAQTSSNGWGIQRDVTHTLDATGGDAIAFLGRGSGADATHDLAPTMRSLPCTDGHQSGATGLAVAFRQQAIGLYEQGDLACTVKARDRKQASMLVWHNKQSAGEIRVQDDGTIPTMTKTWGTGGNNVPFVGVRRLTPLECERLQGFPDGWTACGIDEDGQAVEISDTQRYKQLGNAVTVNVVQWIGRRILQAI